MNPHVSGVQYLPDEVFGDDCEADSGQIIQLKESYFDLEVDPEPRPEIYLSHSEELWAERYLKRRFPHALADARPVCILHPWGATNHRVLDGEFWAQLVMRLKGSFQFWQVGIEGHPKIPGCNVDLLLPARYLSARLLFAMVRRASLFAGLDSGPMHVARAFRLPSLVFTQQTGLAEVFERRKTEPYYLRHSWAHAFLYADNAHVSVPEVTRNQALEEAERFFLTKS